MGKHRTSIGLGELLALKHRFGVSIQALTHRCKDLSIIGQSLYRSLFAEFECLGWRRPPYKEFGAMTGEAPSRFNRLCLRALSEGAITDLKAAEFLEVTRAQIAQYMRGTLRAPAADE